MKLPRFLKFLLFFLLFAAVNATAELASTPTIKPLNNNALPASSSLASMPMAGLPASNESQMLNLSSDQFGLTGPLSLSMQYSKDFGTFWQGKFNELINPSFGTALDFEGGEKLYRVNGTGGYILTPNQWLKFTAEYLTQDINFDFTSGDVNKWIGQGAYGLTYQYLLPYNFFKSIDLNAFYSQAQSKTLDPIFYINANDDLYENFRHIAGGRDAHGAIGFNLLPTKYTAVTLNFSYDLLRYDTKYHNPDGTTPNYDDFGAGITLEQLLGRSLKLDLGANTMPAYNDYTTGISWLVPTKRGIAVELGLTGEYVAGNHGLQNDERIGLNANISWGASYNGKGQGYNLDLSNSLGDFNSWVATPAVYMAQVLVVKDEYNKLITDTDPYANPNFTIGDIEAVAGTYFSQTFEGLKLFFDPLQSLHTLQLKVIGEDTEGLSAEYTPNPGSDDGTLKIFGFLKYHGSDDNNAASSAKNADSNIITIYARNEKTLPGEWSRSVQQFTINVAPKPGIQVNISKPDIIYNIGQPYDIEVIGTVTNSAEVFKDANDVSVVAANGSQDLSNFGLTLVKELSKDQKTITLKIAGPATKTTDTSQDYKVKVVNSDATGEFHLAVKQVDVDIQLAKPYFSYAVGNEVNEELAKVVKKDGGEFTEEDFNYINVAPTFADPTLQIVKSFAKNTSGFGDDRKTITLQLATKPHQQLSQPLYPTNYFVTYSVNNGKSGSVKSSRGMFNLTVSPPDHQNYLFNIPYPVLYFTKDQLINDEVVVSVNNVDGTFNDKSDLDIRAADGSQDFQNFGIVPNASISSDRKSITFALTGKVKNDSNITTTQHYKIFIDNKDTNHSLDMNISNAPNTDVNIQMDNRILSYNLGDIVDSSTNRVAEITKADHLAFTQSEKDNVHVTLNDTVGEIKAISVLSDDQKTLYVQLTSNNIKLQNTLYPSTYFINYGSKLLGSFNLGVVDEHPTTIDIKVNKTDPLKYLLNQNVNENDFAEITKMHNGEAQTFTIDDLKNVTIDGLSNLGIVFNAYLINSNKAIRIDLSGTVNNTTNGPQTFSIKYGSNDKADFTVDTTKIVFDFLKSDHVYDYFKNMVLPYGGEICKISKANGDVFSDNDINNVEVSPDNFSSYGLSLVKDISDKHQIVIKLEGKPTAITADTQSYAIKYGNSGSDNFQMSVAGDYAIKIADDAKNGFALDVGQDLGQNGKQIGTVTALNGEAPEVIATNLPDGLRIEVGGGALPNTKTYPLLLKGTAPNQVLTMQPCDVSIKGRDDIPKGTVKIAVDQVKITPTKSADLHYYYENAPSKAGEASFTVTRQSATFNDENDISIDGLSAIGINYKTTLAVDKKTATVTFYGTNKEQPDQQTHTYTIKVANSAVTTNFNVTLDNKLKVTFDKNIADRNYIFYSQPGDEHVVTLTASNGYFDDTTPVAVNAVNSNKTPIASIGISADPQVSGSAMDLHFKGNSTFPPGKPDFNMADYQVKIGNSDNISNVFKIGVTLNGSELICPSPSEFKFNCNSNDKKLEPNYFVQNHMGFYFPQKDVDVFRFCYPGDKDPDKSHIHFYGAQIIPPDDIRGDAHVDCYYYYDDKNAVGVILRAHPYSPYNTKFKSNSNNLHTVGKEMNCGDIGKYDIHFIPEEKCTVEVPP
jgi:hypothetical protein